VGQADSQSTFRVRHQVHARENEDVVAAVLPEARELGFDLTVRPS